MNGLPHERELPELNDDQIVLLDAICKAASAATSAPFKSLTEEYNRHFRERGLDTSRDNAVFRWIMRVGDSARRQHRIGRRTNYVPYLRSILEAHGITVIDEEENGEIDGVTRSLEEQTPPREKSAPPKRRVSFHDARLEETWLSERSPVANALPVRAHQELLSQHPTRGRNFAVLQRARSVSSERRPFGPRQPAPKHFQEASPSSDYTSEHEEHRNPTLFFEPSQTQLEQNAEAFLVTSDIRLARAYLHVWHDAALVHKNLQAHDYARAAAHDERQLLKNSFDCMTGLYRARQHERQVYRLEQEELAQRHAQLQINLEVAEQRRHHWLVYKAFTHWHDSLAYQNRKTNLGKQIILRKRYFRRWRRIAVNNARKARSILSRKYLRLWHVNTARQLLTHEQADAHYEEALTRRFLLKWLRDTRSRQHEEDHEKRVERRAFDYWHFRLEQQRTKESQAAALRARNLKRFSLNRLARACDRRHRDSLSVSFHYDRKVSSKCMQVLQIHAKLSPLARKVSYNLTLNLERKIFTIWHLQLCLTRRAAEVEHKRILQRAWTTWNDSLRCKALAQRIDERILIEAIHRWVLRARQQALQSSMNERLARRTLATWHHKVKHSRGALQQASACFDEGHRRRRLTLCMFRLNIAIRNREDAERAAVEFSNSRALPDVLAVWKQHTEHARMLAKWAVDARFYCLSTKALKLWQERTTEHKQNRRREAYAHVRARVKIRIARTNLERLRSRSVQIRSLQMEASARTQTRVFSVGTSAFDKWREMTTLYIDMEMQARAADQQKLVASSFSAMISKHTDLAAMEQQALLFRQESNVALLASALRRIQWMMFTAARRAESADALWARNRDQHVKQMVRHWASQVAVRKRARSAPADEVESPSLRPASRAASRSTERPALPSSPPTQTATPGYMRTPSRSRRAARFRPLPTPALVTPMAFDNSYFATTPAPLVSARPPKDTLEFNQHGNVFEGLTPQITPFARKLRAGGVVTAPPSALRTSTFGRSVAGGTNKSVRFAGSSRFGSTQRKLKTTEE